MSSRGELRFIGALGPLPSPTPPHGPGPSGPPPCPAAAGSILSWHNRSNGRSRTHYPPGPGQEPWLPLPAGSCWDWSLEPVMQNPAQHCPTAWQCWGCEAAPCRAYAVESKCRLSSRLSPAAAALSNHAGLWPGQARTWLHWGHPTPSRSQPQHCSTIPLDHKLP